MKKPLFLPLFIAFFSLNALYGQSSTTQVLFPGNVKPLFQAKEKKIQAGDPFTIQKFRVSGKGNTCIQPETKHHQNDMLDTWAGLFGGFKKPTCYDWKLHYTLETMDSSATSQIMSRLRQHAFKTQLLYFTEADKTGMDAQDLFGISCYTYTDQKDQLVCCIPLPWHDWVVLRFRQTGDPYYSDLQACLFQALGAKEEFVRFCAGTGRQIRLSRWKPW